ncbi:MAG TPA: S41 family peptidase [Myxococcaceae bacterium]|nr:S41 family peptidase [Myxococcaceae bacterium]
MLRSHLPFARIALLLGALLLTPEVQAQAPASGPSTAEEDAERYRSLETFARVLSYVEGNYVDPVERSRLMEGAIHGMLQTLDPHTVYMPPDVFRAMKMDTAGAFGGLGLEIARKGERIVVISPLDDTPASRAGIRAGDELVAIDGKALRGMELAEVMRLMRGAPGEKAQLTLMRRGFAAPRTFAVVRDHIRVRSVEGGLHGDVAHLRIKSFQDRTDAQLRRELERLQAQLGDTPLKGIVLDLRNNPGGLLEQAVAVASRFLDDGLTIVTTRGRNGRRSGVEKSRGPASHANTPMVVLINAGTASASEIVAGALQDHQRAVLMGSRTFGKGSVQTVISFEDGSGLKLTIARYDTPSGRSIQERGIWPDFLVEEPPQGTKPILREQDLARHLVNETAAPDPQAPPPPPPEAQRDYASTLSMKDAPLRAALNLLHHGGTIRTATSTH